MLLIYIFGKSHGQVCLVSTKMSGYSAEPPPLVVTPGLLKRLLVLVRPSQGPVQAQERGLGSGLIQGTLQATSDTTPLFTLDRNRSALVFRTWDGDCGPEPGLWCDSPALYAPSSCAAVNKCISSLIY